RAETAEIDGELRRERKESRKVVKILLLGPGESGKTTILKQMKILHQDGFTPTDRTYYKEIIFSNTTQSMKIILQAMDELSIPVRTENLVHRSLVLSLPANIHAQYLPGDIATAIEALFVDPGVEEAIIRNNEYQLNDSATYYFGQVRRMSAKDYSPSDVDILRSRVKTTGINEISFKYDDHTYKVFDVGGQRSERRKWIHCFENLNAVVFMVSMSEYDQVLREDETVNRMQESLILFDSICNSRWFGATSMILFLNKMDLLADKVTRSPLSLYLTDYDGPNTYEEAVIYFRRTFIRCNREAKTIYTHVTCATDTRQIKFVLKAMIDILIKEQLKNTGFL
ncbi:G-protein alpha subunit, partial [Clavulina sp. PMI_390]